MENTARKRSIFFMQKGKMLEIKNPRIDNEGIINTGNRKYSVGIFYLIKLAIDATIVAKEAKEVA